MRHTCQLAGFDAQDILQEAYIKSLPYWPEPLADLTAAQQQAWVATTVGRILIDLLRAPEYRLHTDVKPTESDLSAIGSRDLSEQLGARERLLRVCRHILKLGEREQDVVVRYALLGYGCGEIADHLGASPGSVTTALSRARANLAKMISEEGQA